MNIQLNKSDLHKKKNLQLPLEHIGLHLRLFKCTGDDVYLYEQAAAYEHLAIAAGGVLRIYLNTAPGYGPMVERPGGSSCFHAILQRAVRQESADLTP